MEKTLKFALEKETPGAGRYQEVDDNGRRVVMAKAIIGQLYIRKSAMPNGVPSTVVVTIKL